MVPIVVTCVLVGTALHLLYLIALRYVEDCVDIRYGSDEDEEEVDRWTGSN